MHHHHRHHHEEGRSLSSQPLTRWKVEKEARSAGFGKELDDLPVSVHRAPRNIRDIKQLLVDNKGPKDRYLQRQHCVDHSFLDEVPTELELLDGLEHIYIRPATTSEQDLAEKLKKTTREEMFEILDNNGFRLYFVCTKVSLAPYERRSLRGERFEFTWYDYHGHEIVGTCGQIEACSNCCNEVQISIPSDNPEDDLPLGEIKPGNCCCQFICRPQLTVTSHYNKTVSYKIVPYKDQYVCCTTGEHTLEEFEMIDPDDLEFVGKLFKLDGFVDFSHNGKLPYSSSSTSPLINFNGFAVYFAHSEVGSEMKAMLICGAFLLNEHYFQRTGRCFQIPHSGLCSTVIVVLLVMSILGFGAIGVISYL